MTQFTPTLLPLGDRAILLRFSNVLNDAANHAANLCAARLKAAQIPGVIEIVPNLVSIAIHYDPFKLGYDELAGQIRLKLSEQSTIKATTNTHNIGVLFGGEAGPDFAEVANSLHMSETEFIAAHNAAPLRILATGFAPGFVYCGMHSKNMELPRRREVRQSVPAGTVLFAAGQTAITATAIPTGWHVIGRTNFDNFDVSKTPPTILNAGDKVTFETEQ